MMYINKNAGYVNHINSTRKDNNTSAIGISMLIMAGVTILAVILS